MAAAEAGADAVGFVFVEGTPRSVAPDAAFEIMAVLPPFVSTVGLLRNASLDQFLEVEQSCPTTMTQLHGTEPEKLVRDCGPGVIKAVRYDGATIAAELDRWAGVDEVDAILIDGSDGGEGRAFDWASVAPLVEKLAKPCIVAGGLTPENVGEAIRTLRPWAVDVSSGVERKPGVKDPALIEAFCRAVREADAAAHA